jgi:hypothetical protein
MVSNCVDPDFYQELSEIYMMGNPSLLRRLIENHNVSLSHTQSPKQQEILSFTNAEIQKRTSPSLYSLRKFQMFLSFGDPTRAWISDI